MMKLIMASPEFILAGTVKNKSLSIISRGIWQSKSFGVQDVKSTVYSAAYLIQRLQIPIISFNIRKLQSAEVMSAHKMTSQQKVCSFSLKKILGQNAAI